MPHYDGTFCSYDLDLAVGTNDITFTGSTKAAPGTVYQFTLASGGNPGYEPPALNDVSPISHRFVRSQAGTLDIVLPPNPLPENRIKGQLQSFGHGGGMRLPIRLQVGSQDENDQHSGSGMIHLLFAHSKTDLNGIVHLLNTILLPSNIGAIYKTKAQFFNHYRFSWLSRNKFPIQLVTEGHDTYHRVITVFKGNDDITKYNKYKSHPNDYACIYRWDKDKF